MGLWENARLPFSVLIDDRSSLLPFSPSFDFPPYQCSSSRCSGEGEASSEAVAFDGVRTRASFCEPAPDWVLNEQLAEECFCLESLRGRRIGIGVLVGTKGIPPINTTKYLASFPWRLQQPIRKWFTSLELVAFRRVYQHIETSSGEAVPICRIAEHNGRYLL